MSLAALRRAIRTRSIASAIVVVALLLLATEKREVPQIAASEPVQRLASEAGPPIDSHEPLATDEPSRAVAEVVPPSPSVSAEAARPEQPVTIPTAVAAAPACPDDGGARTDVRKHGAKGDGFTDDSEAIQAANDEMAAKGGGTVYFPPARYRAYAIEQDTCVKFVGSAGRSILVHRDGSSPRSVIESRVRTTTGAVAAGSNVLRVASTQGLRPGGLVAIRGGGGPSLVQRTELGVAARANAQVLSVRSTKGLPRTRPNHLYVGNELVSYEGMSGNLLLKVRRGLGGTTRVRHPVGTAVAQAATMYAEVVSVSPSGAVLDRPASATVSGVEVRIGSVGMLVQGLTIDGSRPTGGSPATNPMPLDYRLARWATIRGSTFVAGDHGGISFDMGTRDSTIEDSELLNNGDAGHSLGAGVWLFRGASRNTVRNNRIVGSGPIGVMIDDRTVSSSEFDAPSNANAIVANTIDVPYSENDYVNIGVLIDSSSANRVVDNDVSNARTGIGVIKTRQASVRRDARHNVVEGNRFTLNQVGIFVTGSRNDFIKNVVQPTREPYVDNGYANRFVDNVIMR